MSPDKIQLNIRITADLAARLDNISATYRKSGRSQVAQEILELCCDIYEKAEQAKFEVLQKAKQALNSRET